MFKSLPCAIKISGEAGDGILTIGDIILLSLIRQGLYGTLFKNIPSSIRSGISEIVLSVSREKIVSPYDTIDIFFALNEQSFVSGYQDVKKEGTILIESTFGQSDNCRSLIESLNRHGYRCFFIPVEKLYPEWGMASTKSATIMGILSWILDLPIKNVEILFSQKLRSKGEKIVEFNKKILSNAYIWAQKYLHTEQVDRVYETGFTSPQKIVLDGNQALSLGALAAGCSFFSSYPITPATSIGEYLAEYLSLTGGVVYQAEDEIAALGAVVGASFSGCKAMTATSGPGLSLMQEFISYGSIVELPLVIVDVQRVGPSTGMPTKFSQDDLLAAVFGGHGEDQRIVLSPLSVLDCFYAAITAFALAEQYRCPVIILSDSATALAKDTVEHTSIEWMGIGRELLETKTVDKKNVVQYSTRAGYPIPGVSEKTCRITGLEHDCNFIPVENHQIRSEQITRRFLKISSVEINNPELVQWDLETSDSYNADIALISWGFTVGAAKVAIARLRKKGYSVAAFYPKLLYPVCKNAVKRLLQYNSRIIIPEANFTGQYSSLLRMYVDFSPVALTISNGEPWSPDAIEKKLTELVNSHEV